MNRSTEINFKPLMKKFYLTTPIYYVNAMPHLGHLYTTLVADTITRYKRQRGFDVFFLTGTDEHGQYIERAASAAHLAPQEHVDRIVEHFRQMIRDFGFQPSHFIRTTDSYHKQGVTELFKRVQEAGYIYKGRYEGWFCVNCGEFQQSEDGKAPVCPIHEKEDEWVAEESYFFKLSQFQDRLLKYYQEHPQFIQPEARRNEVISFVSSGLKDLSVSRTSVRWGIAVPGDPKHTLYVWFDALSNYITALGYGNSERSGFDRYWPADLQLVGKDILRFHTVYWPAFLMAAGVEPPKTVFAHGFWLSGGRKMSKSLGNAIELSILKKYFTNDSVRYFCLREMVFGQDGDFTYSALIDRINSDLAAGLGNLSSRTLTMVRNYCDSRIPAASADLSVEAGQQAENVQRSIEEAKEKFEQEFSSYNFSRALDAVWAGITSVDKYISESAPWNLAKDASKRAHLETVLYTSAEALRQILLLLAPVLPNSTERIWQQMGLAGKPAEINPESQAWGGLQPGTKIGEVSPVFPRIDKEKTMSEIEREQPKPEAEKETKEPGATQADAVPQRPQYIAIDDFAKVDLRVAEVKSAERVPKADKLLKLIIDLGEAEPRQIIAGIAQYYSPEQLIGRKIIVVANLMPRKLRGLESNGMLLAASVGEEGRPVLAGFLEEVPVGAKLK